MGEPKWTCFPAVFFNRKSPEGNSNGKNNNIIDNFSMLKPGMVLKNTSNEHPRPKPTLKNRKSFIKPRLSGTFFSGKQNLEVSGLGSITIKLFTESVSERTFSLNSDARVKGTINHYEMV